MYWMPALAVSLLACAEAPVRAALPFDGNGACIVGYVSNELTQRPLSGALVVATSPEHQGEETAVTDDDGEYMFVGLPSGVYRVHVELANYVPDDQENISARVSRRLRVNFSLAPLMSGMIYDAMKVIAPMTDVGNATWVPA
jgi:hypothetical protein